MATEIKETETRVYKYGLLYGPKTEQERIMEQWRLANRYRNDLVELELRRRKAYRELRTRRFPDLEQLEQQEKVLATELGELLAAVKQTKVAGKRDRSQDPVIKERRDKLRELRTRLKEQRQQSVLKGDPEVIAMDHAFHEEAKALRAACRVYWGTYLLIENAVDQAKKSKMDPQFRRWTGGGRCGVQFQGGITVPELFSGEDTRLRLSEPIYEQKPNMTGTARSRRANTRSHLDFRVGSTDTGKPIFARFLLSYHRPLPPEAVIKWAIIVGKKVGPRIKWELHLTLEMEKRPVAVGVGEVAVNFGWHTKDDGALRVAMLSTGEEVLLSADHLWLWKRAFELQSTSDRSFDENKRAVVAFLAEHPDLGPLVSETWRGIGQLQKKGKLAAIAMHVVNQAGREKVNEIWQAWRQTRLAEKKDLWAPAAEILALAPESEPLLQLALVLEFWRRQSRHLYAWLEGLRKQAIGRRRDQYRVVARKLANAFETLVIEDFDLTTFARLPAVENEEAAVLARREQQRQAAPGELRQSLLAAFGKERVKIVKETHLTVKCGTCGHINPRPKTRLLTCENCGAAGDQDLLNTHNQLRATAAQ